MNNINIGQYAYNDYASIYPVEDMIQVYVGDGHDLFTAGKRTHKFDDGSYMLENEHNEPVALELIILLRSDPRFSVMHTSPLDTYESLTKRTKKANDHYKKMGIARARALYVSAHANADSSKTWSSAKGCEVLHYPGSIEGYRFAKLVSKEISEALSVPNRGAKARKNLAVLNKTDMPAIITEAMFMTNKIEAKKLMDPALRKKEAYAIYKGICIGFGLKPLDQTQKIDQVKLILDPDQDSELIISTKKALNVDQIMQLLNNIETQKSYTVSETQAWFNKFGYYCGEVDGNKGPKTTGAIRAFQRLNDLDNTGNMNPETIACMERLEKDNGPYRTMWFNDSEVHIYTGSLDDHEVGVGLGKYGKLEKLSEMASDYTCAVNGQFFGGGREGLGTLIRKGLYYFKPVNDKFANWIQYKSGKSEIRDVRDSELYNLQMTTDFTIGTSWPLIVKGALAEILSGGITHKFSRHPRSLMADASTDKLCSLIVIDGRRINSKGMTAKQCQELLKYIEKVLGIKYYNATNLDGGGSTEMMIDGRIVNIPSEGSERRIGTFVYLNRRN